MPFGYRNRQIGTRRVDFPVEDVIPVELKALIQLEDVHLAQAICYLNAYNIKWSLRVRRLINSNEKRMASLMDFCTVAVLKRRDAIHNEQPLL